MVKWPFVGKKNFRDFFSQNCKNMEKDLCFISQICDPQGWHLSHVVQKLKNVSNKFGL